jgi:hypothetical protein
VHEVDRSSGHLLSCGPYTPPVERRRRGGECRTTPFGRVLMISGELLVGEFECEPVLHSLGVG